MSQDTEDIYSDLYSSFSQSTTTTENDIEQQPYPLTWRTGTVFTLATIGGLLFGYDTGVISGVLISLKPQDLQLTELTNSQKELITSITSAGSFFGSLLAFPTADHWGRKYTLAFCCTIFAVAAIIMALSNSIHMLVFGRSIVGVAIGIAAQCIPVYLSEISPTKIRGFMLTLNSIAITGGQVIAYCISLFLISKKTQAWRYLFGVSAIPAVIFILLLDFIPESPRLLITKGKMKEAEHALKMIYPSATEQQVQNKLRKMVYDLTKLRKYIDEEEPLLSRNNSVFKRPSMVSLQRFLLPHQDVSSPRSSVVSSSAIVPTKRHHRMEARTKRALFVGCSLMFFQQIIGFNAFMYYSATIFSGLNVQDPLLPAIVVAVTNFVFTIVAMRLIDRCGRRAMVLNTTWIMTVGLLLCSIGFEYNNLALLLTSVMVYVAAYASGMGAVPWTSVEFLPLNRRSFGASCISCTNWLTNSLVSVSYLTVMDSIGNENTMLVFAGFTVLNWFFVYFWYPEVKGLSLEEIGKVFENGIDVHYVYRNYHS